MATPVTIPLACWIGLAVAGAEVSGGSYARMPATLVYAVDGTTVANNATIEWPEASAGWGAIDSVQVWDAATAGNLLLSLSTAAVVTVAPYAIARISDADIQALLLPPLPRPYSMGPFGVGKFSTNYDHLGAATQPVLLEITFDTSAHVCGPGQWAPGPWKAAA